MAEVITATVFERSSTVLLARVRNPQGGWIAVADISAIHYAVWDIQADPPEEVVSGTSLTVGDVVFDTLQTDDRWVVDDLGYNFAVELPATSFPTAHIFRVDFKFTPTSGGVFRLAFELDALPVYAAD